MGHEIRMTESEFLRSDNRDLLGEGHVNWLPPIHHTLLDHGFSHIETSPNRVHVYHHNTDAEHPLAGARAVASFKGYKLFYRDKMLAVSRQVTLEKHLRQLAGHLLSG